MAQDINNFIDPKLINSMEQMNAQLILAGKNVDSLVPKFKTLETAQKGLGKTQKDNNKNRKDLTEAEKDAAKVAKQLEAAEKKLISVQTKQQDNLIKVKTELQKATKASKDLQRAQSAQRGSTEQLMAVNTILEKRLRNVNQTTDKGKRSADLLRSAIDRNNKTIKKQSSALTAQKINIGNYSNSMVGAASASGLFSRELMIVSRLQETLTALTQKKTIAQNASTAATTLGSKALNVFKIALISTGIGAILVALGSLVAYFKSSEEGAAALSRMLSPFKILFGNLSDLAIQLGGALSNAFENPKEAIAGLWEAIKKNLINRVQGIIDTFKFMGKTIQAALNLDWDAVKENAGKAGESIVQSLTGVDDAIGKATNSIKAFAAENAKENEQNKQLATDRLALIKKEREFSIQSAKLEVEIQNNRLKLKDEENFSNAERLRFAEIAQEQINEQSRLENELSAKRLEYRQLENSFSTSSQEDLDAEAQLQVALINVQAANAKKLLRIESEKQTIIRKIKTEDIAFDKEQRELRLEEQAQDETLIEADIAKMQEKADLEVEIITNKNTLIKESNQEIEDAKQAALVDTANILESMFEKESTIGKAALAAKRASAIKEQLISLGIIGAKNAEAQAKSAAILPFPANIPLILGTISQFASIIGIFTKFKIPAFAKGTNYAPGGAAIVGEKGRELIQSPSGKISLANNPSLVNLERGSKVIPNRQTEAILNDGNIVGELKLTRKAIQRMPKQRNESRFNARQRGYNDGYLASKHRLN